MRLLSLIGWIAWPLSIGAGVFVFGASSIAVLDLVAQHAPAAQTTAADRNALLARWQMAPVAAIPATAKPAVAAVPVPPQAPPAPNPAAVAPTPPQGPSLTVTATALVMRSGPGTSHPRLASLANGETVTLLRAQGRWDLVRRSSGETGWAWSGYLDAADDTQVAER